MKSKHCETGRNPTGGISRSVKVHLLVIDSHYYYFYTFDLSPVKKFKSCSTKMIEKKFLFVHEKNHLSFLVLYNHSRNGGHIFRVKLS